MRSMVEGVYNAGGRPPPPPPSAAVPLPRTRSVLGRGFQSSNIFECFCVSRISRYVTSETPIIAVTYQ